MTESTIITFTSFDEAGKEFTQTLPARWAICLGCFGAGFVDDPTLAECTECSGTGDVAEPIRALADPAVLAEYDAMNEAAYRDAVMEEAA